jgi:peptide/nickel transport system substrate-binding protein
VNAPTTPTRRLRTGLSILTATAVLVLAAACGGTSSSAKEGGVLRIATSSGIDSLNPFVGINQDDFSVWTYTYPHLLNYDTRTPSYDYTGNFAKSWKVSAEGRTVTFHTIPGAKWSDGRPLTAADVAWTFDLMKKYAGGALSGTAQAVKFLDSVVAKGPNTVVATYSRPTGTALYDLGTTAILPRHVWQKYAAGNGAALKRFANQPSGGKPLVSGGPFVLVKYQKDAVAVFQRNPNWYGPKPHIDGFGLQYFSNDDAMVSALKTGQVDVIEQVPPTGVKALQNAGMHVYSGPALSLRDFIINVNPDKSHNRELLNPKVREALEYATDRNAIVQTAWLGHALPGSSIIPVGSATGGVEWHNPALEPLPYDPARANQILDSVGYRRGSNGIRIANGHPMSYDVVFAKDESGPGTRAFQTLQQGFAKIGVQIRQRIMDDSSAWNAIYCGDKCAYTKFDFAMWDWFPAADPDFILAAMTCAQWGDWNDSGFCDKHYDALYEQQRHTSDPRARQQIVWEMQQIIRDARPYIVLTYDRRLDAWSPRWTGLVESVQGMFNNFSTQSLLSVRQR